MQSRHTVLNIAKLISLASHACGMHGDVVRQCAAYSYILDLINTDLRPPPHFTKVKYNTSQGSIGGYSCAVIVPARPPFGVAGYFCCKEIT